MSSRGTDHSEIDTRSFFRALFDLNFTSWVTLRVAGILYIFSLIIGGLLLFFIFVAWARAAGDIGGLILVLLLPLSLFLLTLTLRLIFEAAVATVAIARNTAHLRDYPRNDSGNSQPKPGNGPHPIPPKAQRPTNTTKKSGKKAPDLDPWEANRWERF